jgi:hypothetical protein
MYPGIVLAASALLSTLSSAQQLKRDSGVAGAALELVHLYNDQWPTGSLPRLFRSLNMQYTKGIQA